MARARDPHVIQVMAGLGAEYDVVLVAGSDGRLAADVRPLVRLSLTVIAERNGRREMGHAGGGGRLGLAYFTDEMLQGYVERAVHEALVNLEARPAPAGEMTVVLGSGWPGILLHEAVGHGLEGDFNRKGSSVFSGRIGERVASKGVTVIDDGTIPDRRGSLNIDDEGNATQRNVLIEDGILRGYMQDTLNARLMKTAATGNGRRESFAHLPMPRMTNTYMLAGETPPEEIVSSVKRGLYAVNFGGGQVDITNGKFCVLGLRGLHDRERQDHLSGQGRHPDRQRSGRHEPRHADRQRHEAGLGRRHLRQGWPERAGGRGHAHGPHGRPDGGRHGLSRIGPAGRARAWSRRALPRRLIVVMAGGSVPINPRDGEKNCARVVSHEIRVPAFYFYFMVF